MGKQLKQAQRRAQQSQRKRLQSVSKNDDKDLDFDGVISDDEVDAYYAQKDKILLDQLDDGSDNDLDAELLSESEEEVLAMNMDDQQSDSADYNGDMYSDGEGSVQVGESDMEDALNMVPALRKHVKSGGSDYGETDGGEDAEDSMKQQSSVAWGKNRNAYYDDDLDMDDDAGIEEEEEAERLRREQLAAMGDDDFLDGSFASKLQKQSSASANSNSIPLLSTATPSDDEEDDNEVELVEKVSLSFDGLTSDQVQQIVEQERPELMAMLQEFTGKCKQLNENQAALLVAKTSLNSDGEDRLETNEGLSLLEVKNHLLMNYLLNLSFYLYMRLEGARLDQPDNKAHPVIERLVEVRLYLEKLKPLEAKLKYQIDKLINASLQAPYVQKLKVAGDALGDNVSASSADPLKFKPEIGNFAGVDSDDNSGDDGSGSDAGEKVYKAPKIAPVHYDDTGKKGAGKDGQKKNIPGQSIMKDLLNELSELPEEVHDAGNLLEANNELKEDKKWQERVKAEEEMMMRLTTTKKDKKDVRQQNKLVDELAELDQFGDYALSKVANDRDVLDDMFASSSSRKSDRLRDALSGGDSSEDYGDAGQKQQESDVSDDEYYQSLQNQTRNSKRQQLNEDMDTLSEEEDGAAVGGKKKFKRDVGYDIMKNKGLTPKRTKEQRNPRVKRRKKYEQSLKKLGSMKPSQKQSSGNKYRGEETGIKKNLSRSVRFS
ncbi:hypothetical protein MIR68_004103 [Amoeboaphelidium protococcarum]|nr:hypothetical protein MIR68_004103 [Amoeboaphelidium protococcarum]